MRGWALLGQFRLSLGSSPQPQPRASGRWKAQLSALPCLGAGSLAAPAAGTARGRHSLPCRQALLPQLAPLPSPPHGAAWHRVPGWSIPPRLEQSCPAVRREMPAGTQATAAQVYRAHTVQGHRALPRRGTGHCCAGTEGARCAGMQGTRCPTSPLPSRCPSFHLCRQGCVSAGELAAPAPAALHNQEIALHKRHLTCLFLNQRLFTPSSVPLAADCPLSPARPRSVAAQAAGPRCSHGRQAQRCSQCSSAFLSPRSLCPPQLLVGEDAGALPAPGAYPSVGWRGAPGLGSLPGAGFGPTWVQDPAAPAPVLICGKVAGEHAAGLASGSVWRSGVG